ncbi:MAG: hypothetical protein WC729_05390 [Sphingomonas sp.]|jgi:hypothetical protein|uniref:hypothetical protein n=1 Tax=Sphingomonas sp. TaxID=28214 RepID=UPI0035632D5B
MWRRIASWRGRDAASAPGAIAGPPDRDRLVRAGEALRSSYRQDEDDDSLDDRMVSLMLELSVEPTGSIDPGRRARPSIPR